MPIFALAIDRFLGGNGEDFLELPMHRRDVGVRQIDLVDHRDDRQALLVGEVDVGHRLRLDALGRVDDQQRAFAGREAARDFIGEIDVARRVEQVEPVFLPVLRRVTHRHRVRLDRDPALALEIHRVEELVLLLAVVDRAGALEQPIRQGRLAVIDVRDDAEIAGQLDRHEGAHYAGAPEGGQRTRPVTRTATTHSVCHPDRRKAERTSNYVRSSLGRRRCEFPCKATWLARVRATSQLAGEVLRRASPAQDDKRRDLRRACLRLTWQSLSGKRRGFPPA